MDQITILVNKFKLALHKLSDIFKSVSASAELKLDAFIFSKQKQPQIRALISGTGLHINIPLDQMNSDKRFLPRFSHHDQEIIKNVINDTTDLCSHLIEGRKIRIVAKTMNRITKKIALTVSVTDYYNKNIEFEVDPSELSRNKFLLHLFNKMDTFNIGYSAAESRIRTEQAEVKKIKGYIQKIN